ncbi:hypothetical protein QVD17_39954 [Tagetes erecta]|uniref:BAG family molecular chaperone regulator 1 n=1 Tax=Tagetes erecta TaxID=13708 RepID=A0AAD8NHM1_TARER|nr:hypothetical protein QVD17_39954 [Tagetes erecta]
MLGVKSAARNIGRVDKVRKVHGGAWDHRPCGMLVQKRSSDVHQTQTLVPITIKVKVRCGSSYYEVHIQPQATFGELKKMLAGPSGLNPLDQKLLYRDKERDSEAYLDATGVKDGSRMVMFIDITSQENRLLENIKIAKTNKANKQLVEITSEIDTLVKQVGNLEINIYTGKKVVEKFLLNVIESLMSQLIKLDGIVADGEVKLQRRMQVKRVQKYIEFLDVLKIRNSKIASNGYEGNVRAPVQRLNKNSFE